MSQSWDIDPKTGDYIMAGGQPVQTDSLRVPSYFRLKGHRKGFRQRDGTPGGWLYAPDKKWGSAFWTQVGTRISTRDTTKLETTAQQALQPLADTGRASKITLDVLGAGVGNISLRAKIVETNGNVDQLNMPSLGV